LNRFFIVEVDFEGSRGGGVRLGRRKMGVIGTLKPKKCSKRNLRKFAHLLAHITQSNP
jgi:hypothetical protein